ncbi:heavy metal-binding protein HIP-like [Mizuhopecten yessoensis]|uniref:Heavy metal-binding protein HIP n=1 Tax=Mizuhopecten yessoensis TaxID=6573 RepID=A0A210QWP5_MIZYE|nr:heavy metal-binding protein HIP-like [Mizuhopecten yessoensis]OWF53199.1 Heavy metal-binding protein HIP [Mizuhopecten yessoensis]
MATRSLFMCVLLVNLSSAQPSDSLESRLEKMEQQFIQMKSELQTTRDDLEATRSQLRDYQAKVEETRTEMAVMGRSRRVMYGQKTAFSAQMRPSIDHLVIHQTIVFESVVLNEGGAYDNLTGVFTCPVEGVYYFSVSIMSWTDEDIETVLVVNGGRVVSNYAAGQQHFNVGSSSVVVRLKVGDKVWVHVVPSLNNPPNIRMIGRGWTTYTGFMI